MADRLNAPGLPASQTAQAIFRTLLYADVFQFPLTEREIHHFLIGHRATRGEVHAALTYCDWLAVRVHCVEGFYTLSPDVVGVVKRRKERELYSARLWPLAEGYGKLLAHLPFVRLVALTGALAMHNPRTAKDDIDFMLVTAPGRVWLTRLLAVIVVRLARLRGVELCPNFVLAESALHQDRHDLYVAHEVTQMIPLAGFVIYEAMREANAWADDLLPNAYAPYYLTADSRPSGIGLLVQRALEIALSTPLGSLIEGWEFRRKQRKFAAALQGERSTARMDADQVKGHFEDHGLWVMEQYNQRLTDHHINEEEVQLERV